MLCRTRGVGTKQRMWSCATEAAAYVQGGASVAQANRLDIALAGRAAAIAIDGCSAGFAFAIGAAIIFTFICGTTASCVSALLWFVSHGLMLLA